MLYNISDSELVSDSCSCAPADSDGYIPCGTSLLTGNMVTLLKIGNSVTITSSQKMAQAVYEPKGSARIFVIENASKHSIFTQAVCCALWFNFDPLSR